MYELALCLSVACFLGVVVYYTSSPAFSLFHPMNFYLAFHGLVFVIRPICGYFLDYRFLYGLYQFSPSVSDKTTVILASTLGLLVFTIACMARGNVAMAFRCDQFDAEERRQMAKVFVWVAVICGPVAFYSLLKDVGGHVYDGMVLDSATGFTINTTQNGYISDAQVMLASMGAILIWLARFRIWSWIPLLTFVVFRSSTGSRGPFVVAVAMALLFFAYEKRMKLPGLRVALAVSLLGAGFIIVGADRGQAIRQLVGWEQSGGQQVTRHDNQKFLESMDFANQEFFEYLVYVVPQRSQRYDYFLDNLQILTAPIPRVLWPGKPIGEPVKMVNLYAYGFPIGMTRSLPGEGWYALGWLGVVIWCGLAGYGLGWLYRRFVEGPQSTLQTACYMVFLPGLVIFVRDGVLLSVVQDSAEYLTPVAVWYLVARLAGLPRAADLRRAARLAFARADSVQDNAADQGTAATRRPRTAEPYLPPAVRRRRAALALPASQPDSR